MLSIMSPVVKSAFAAGDPGTASTTTIVAVPLREHQPHIGALCVLVLQVVAILVGVQVAGERIDRLEHAVERAQRDALHVGLFHVLLLDVAPQLR